MSFTNVKKTVTCPCCGAVDDPLCIVRGGFELLVRYAFHEVGGIIPDAPLDLVDERFGHREPFSAGQQGEVRVSFVMLKDTGTNFHDVGPIVAGLGMRLMVLPEIHALSADYTNRIFTRAAVTWIANQALQCGVIDHSSKMRIGHFNLPAPRSEIVLGRRQPKQIPCLGLTGTEHRFSLIKIAKKTKVGEWIFPCVLAA